MKRSRTIKLILLTGVSAGALVGCDPSGVKNQTISETNVYTNNYYVPGAGYYHAPFRAWYYLPYNYFDPQLQRYFFGGQWAAAPHQSITNISPPTSSAAVTAQLNRTDISRGGFGAVSAGHSWFSSS